MTRKFDFVIAGGVSIMASETGMFAKRAKASYVTLAISKNQKKYFRSSQEEDFAGFSSGKKRLTE